MLKGKQYPVLSMVLSIVYSFIGEMTANRKSLKGTGAHVIYGLFRSKAMSSGGRRRITRKKEGA